MQQATASMPATAPPIAAPAPPPSAFDTASSSPGLSTGLGATLRPSGGGATVGDGGDSGEGAIKGGDGDGGGEGSGGCGNGGGEANGGGGGMGGGGGGGDGDGGGGDGGGGDGASTGKTAPLTPSTAWTDTPRAVESAPKGVVFKRWSVSAATVVFGAVICAVTLMLAGVTNNSWMSPVLTPGNAAARRVVNASASKDATSPARVKTLVTTGR